LLTSNNTQHSNSAVQSSLRVINFYPSNSSHPFNLQGNSHNPTSIIPSTTSTPIPNLSYSDFKELLDYGSPIRDSVIHAFLLVLKSLTTNIYFLDTNFNRDFSNHGWSYAYLKYFRHEFSSRHAQSTRFKPTLLSPTIIIPIHIHNNHWITLVRRIIGKTTFFFYSNDLNSANSEEIIQQLYSHENTSSSFHPIGSQWKNIISYTYHPHSNECGPRSLLAAFVTALHPNPSKYILLPFLHANIAQISRWWVANTIISNSLFLPLMRNESINNSIEYPTTSLLKESFPSHIATLPASTPEQNTQESNGNSSINMDPSTTHMTCHTKQRYTQDKYTPPTTSQSSYRPNTQDINQDTTPFKGKCQPSSNSKQKPITL